MYGTAEEVKECMYGSDELEEQLRAATAALPDLVLPDHNVSAQDTSSVVSQPVSDSSSVKPELTRTAPCQHTAHQALTDHSIMQQASAFEPQDDRDSATAKPEPTSAALSEQAADQSSAADISRSEEPEDAGLAFEKDLQSLSTVLSNTFCESGPDVDISQSQTCQPEQSHHLTPEQASSLVWECAPTREPLGTLLDASNKANDVVSAAGAQQKVSSYGSSFRFVDQEH